MNNIQINGQRRWGPPENWIGPPPPHGTEIFVKNLPEEVFELELYAIFSKISTVYEVRLPVNWNGFNKGYAFVRFTTVRGADMAIERLEGYDIRANRKIKVSRSVDNTRLFLSSVPTDKNSDELKNDLLNYVENVKKVYVYPTLENNQVFRGYAFIEFETHRDAAIAKRVLTPDLCYEIFEKKCVAAWANPLPFLDHSVLDSLNVLFMRNIPKDIKGFHLKKIVETLLGGEEIKKVKKLSDFAFLTFKDHKTAEQALNCLKSIPFLLPNREMQVEWATPREMLSTSSVDKEYEELNSSRIKKSFDDDDLFKDPFPLLDPHDYSSSCGENNFNSNVKQNSENNYFQEHNAIKSPVLYKGNSFLTSLEKLQIDPKGNINIPKKSRPIVGSQSKSSATEKTDLIVYSKQMPEYVPNRSTSWSRIARSVDSIDEYTLFPNVSPGSDNCSKDSDDVFYNMKRSPISQLSSPETNTSVSGNYSGRHNVLERNSPDDLIFKDRYAELTSCNFGMNANTINRNNIYKNLKSLQSGMENHEWDHARHWI